MATSSAPLPFPCLSAVIRYVSLGKRFDMLKCVPEMREYDSQIAWSFQDVSLYKWKDPATSYQENHQPLFRMEFGAFKEVVNTQNVVRAYEENDQYMVYKVECASEYFLRLTKFHLLRPGTVIPRLFCHNFFPIPISALTKIKIKHIEMKNSDQGPLHTFDYLTKPIVDCAGDHTSILDEILSMPNIKFSYEEEMREENFKVDLNRLILFIEKCQMTPETCVGSQYVVTLGSRYRPVEISYIKRRMLAIGAEQLRGHNQFRIDVSDELKFVIHPCRRKREQLLWHSTRLVARLVPQTEEFLEDDQEQRADTVEPN